MKPLRIGISSGFDQPDPQRLVYKNRRLLYYEESMVEWIMSENAIGYLVPTTLSRNKLDEIVSDLDGIVFQGGTDVCPKFYGEKAMKPEWGGDPFRDEYELTLYRAFIDRKKPILGICRGAQLMNVFFGGSLYQDIITQVPNSLLHRNWEVYENLNHDADILPGTRLSEIYPGLSKVRINSVHHQGIKKLGKDLIVEAKSSEDGIIEAIRLKADHYVFGVQWHPEFQKDGDTTLLDRKPLLKDFLEACH